MAELEKLDFEIHAEICGSFRRGRQLLLLYNIRSNGNCNCTLLCWPGLSWDVF